MGLNNAQDWQHIEGKATPACPMISRAANWAYRAIISLTYPLVAKLETVCGIRSRVAVIAVWHDDKLLTVRHSYKSGDALPGGALRFGEAPEHAAARELFEEVGIVARPSDLIALSSWKERGGERWLFEYRPHDLPRVVPDGREVVSGQFVTRNRIPSSIRMILKRCA